MGGGESKAPSNAVMHQALDVSTTQSPTLASQTDQMDITTTTDPSDNLNTTSTLFQETYYSSSESTIPTNVSFNNDVPDLPISFTASNVALISIAIPIIILTIVGNALVLLVWLTHRPFRTPSNLYFTSLAFADFLTAFIIIFAIHSSVQENWKFGLIACRIWVTMCLMMNTVTALHLVSIAVDRCRTVTEGVSYIQRRSFKTVAEKLIIIWILSIWAMTPLVFDWEHLSMDPTAQTSCVSKKVPYWVIHFCSASFWFPATFLIITYYRVHQEITRRKALLNNRLRNTQELSSVGNTNDTAHSPACLSVISEYPVVTISKKSSNTSRLLKGKGIRSIMTVVLISGGFIVCWLPWNLVSFYDAFFNSSESKLSPFVFLTTVAIGQTNSLVNPIIYAARMPEFRTAIVILWKKCSCFHPKCFSTSP